MTLLGCPTEQVENQAPVVVIDAPEAGFSALEGAAIEFLGSATDDTTAAAELVATWTAGETELASGPLVDGTTTAPWSALAVGAHDVVLSVVDAEGAAGTASVAVVVRANSAPAVSFTSPVADGVYYEGVDVPVAVHVEDAEDAVADLLSVALTDGAGAEVATPVLDDAGDWSTALTLAAGSHTLVIEAVDSVGLVGSAEVVFAVRPPNVPPTCAITVPADGEVITDEATVVFEGTVGDDQTPAAELVTTLTSSIDGPLADLEPAADGAVSWSSDAPSTGVHTLTLTAVDDGGADCSVSVELIRSRPPGLLITAPDRHSVWNDVDVVPFEAIVYDAEDDETTMSVDWTSDVDGLLGTSFAVASGETELPMSGLTPGLHVVTAEVFDSSGWSASKVLPIVVNGTPTTPAVSLAPDPALTSQPLVVSIDTPSTDVDGDIPVYDYAWSADGVAKPAYNGLHTLPASATTKGEVWEVSVTAGDGIGSSPPDTATATIINSAPSVQSGYIDPPFGVATTVYTALGIGFVDDDQDPEDYLYQWFVDGSSQAGETAATFDATTYPPGSVFHAEMTAWDGTVTGNTVVSASATLNTPPVATAVVTTPAGTADEYDAITASATTSDVDNQTVVMQWQWHNQAGLIAGATSAALTGADFARDDVVYVVGTPDDGVETGASITSASVTIVNSPPTIGNVTVTPASTPVYVNTLLTCAYSGFVDPDGDPDSSTFQWTSDGVSLGAGPTVSSGYSAGATVLCEVTPYDGLDQGQVMSASVNVANRAPVLTSLTVDSPITRDAAATTSFTATDPDGDTVSLITNWTRTRAGTSVLVAVAPTLNPQLFLKGDQLSVSSAAWDGTTQGNSMTAGPVTVQNATPTAPTIQIAPAAPLVAEGGADPLDCTILIASTDSDTNDTLTYNFAWTVDGGPWTGPVATVAHPGDSIPAAHTVDDQIWQCTVTASDDDPSPATSPSDTDSIEVRACGSMDFTGAPAGLVVDWTGNPLYPGSPHPDMTLEAYVRGGPIGDGYLVTSYDGSGSSAAWLYVGPAGAQLPGVSNMLGGAWHHVARVWDSAANGGAGEIRLYVDGILRDSSVPYFGPYFGSLGLYVGGASHAASGNYWDGEIAGLRISDTVRYTGSVFSVPTVYDSDADTLVFLPMTGAVPAFDDGPSAYTVTSNTNVAPEPLGGPYCE